MSAIKATESEFQAVVNPLAVQSANFFHPYWGVTWYGVAFGSMPSYYPFLPRA